MTTENMTPDADDDIPPVARFWGLAVSEWVTYSFVVVSVIAVIYGQWVGAERDAQAERAMETLAALTEAAEHRFAVGGELVCDNMLLNPGDLANDYLTLSVKPAPFDEDDTSLGYGPALFISVVEDDVSGDTWDTAKRLKDLVKEAGEEAAEEKEEHSSRAVADELAANEDGGEAETDEEDDEPRNQLREVREKGFGEKEEYLRYSILASEVAVCRQEA